MNRKVKALMVLKGVKNLDIAREMHVSKTWVSLVLCGHKRSDRIRKAIADAVGMDVEEVWGENEEKVA